MLPWLAAWLCLLPWPSLALELSWVGRGAIDAPPTAAPRPPDLPRGMFTDPGGGGWWRLSIPPGQEPRVLHFSGSWSATIHLVFPGDDTPIRRDRFRNPGPAWGRPSQLPVLLPTTLDAGGEVLLHVSDQRQRRLLPELSGLSDYASASNASHRLVAGNVAALLTMALLAFVFQRSFPDSAYRWLGAMAVAGSGYVLSLEGDLQRLTGALLPGVALARTVAAATIACSHLFLIRFLELDRRGRPAAGVFRALAGMQGAVLLWGWLDVSPWPMLWSNVLLLLAIPVALVEAAHARRDGLVAGRYVLWAWGPALALLALWVLVLHDWLPGGPIDLSAWVATGLTLQAAVLLLGLARDSERLRRAHQHALDQAGRDALTEVFNRRGLDLQRQSLASAQPKSGPVAALLYLDLDHFKTVNDRHGHLVGDGCLRELVARVQRVLPATGRLARLGGEEFLVLLPGSGAAAARQVADTIREVVAGSPFRIEGLQVQLAVSIGVAIWNPGEDFDAAQALADQALYRAKAEGRNRVCVAGLPATAGALPS